jgi:crossover junction endodeoxyribonuclease RusA
MKPVSLKLPWPPSVNTYYRNIGGRAIVSKTGRQYLQAVKLAVLLSGERKGLCGNLAMHIAATPPDARRRDLDNTLKGPLDGLAKAGVYDDDFQICKLTIERLKPSRPGYLIVTITEVE